MCRGRVGLPEEEPRGSAGRLGTDGCSEFVGQAGWWCWQKELGRMWGAHMLEKPGG